MNFQKCLQIILEEDDLFEDRKHLVFGYNTLMDLKIRKKIWKTDPGSKPYTLSGYKRIGEGKEYKDLHKSKNSSVKGVLLNLTDKQLNILDKWEERYRRVVVGNSHSNPIYAYIIKAHVD